MSLILRVPFIWNEGSTIYIARNVLNVTFISLYALLQPNIRLDN